MILQCRFCPIIIQYFVILLELKEYSYFLSFFVISLDRILNRSVVKFLQDCKWNFCLVKLILINLAHTEKKKVQEAFSALSRWIFLIQFLGESNTAQ